MCIMLCPVCDNVRMKEIEKENVLIDICPNCKGVWLDRGELEKITQGLREAQSYYMESNKVEDSYKREYKEPKFEDTDRKHDIYDKYDRYRKHDSYKKYDKYGHPYKHKKKKSMIDILSDFL